MAVIVGKLVHRSTVTDDATLALDETLGVETVMTARGMVVYGIGSLDDGVSGFRLGRTGR